jgi:hypothetical protein
MVTSIGQVQKSSVPQSCLAVRALPRLDYADAFSVRLVDSPLNSAEAFARELFTRLPGWVETMMELRDAIVRPFGLKTGRSLREGRSQGTGGAERIGMFRVMGRANGEILLGEDDSHLDFRISVLCRRDSDNVEFSVITGVYAKRLLGRLYLIPVLPMHRIIVPATMKSLVFDRR